MESKQSNERVSKVVERKTDELNFGRIFDSNPLKTISNGNEKSINKVNDYGAIGYGSLRRLLPLFIGFKNVPLLPGESMLFEVISKNHTTINGRASHNVKITSIAECKQQTIYSEKGKQIVATVNGTLKEFSFLLNSEFVAQNLNSKRTLNLMATEENKMIVISLGHSVII